MRPKQRRHTGERDLFRSRLDQIINMKHELVGLAGRLDWAWIDGQIAPLYSGKGRPVSTLTGQGLCCAVPPSHARRANSQPAAIPVYRRAACGREIERAFSDKGYRGHDAPNPGRVFVSGQKRGVFDVIKRQLKRRSAIELAIGNMKSEGHLGRCYLKGREGDAANAILSAVGYNLRRVLAWMRSLLRLFLIALCDQITDQSLLNRAS